MSIEQALEKLTAAVEANTAALLKSGGTAAGSSSGGTKTSSTKSTAAKSEPKVTPEAATTALSKLKDDFTVDKKGLAKAKEILAKYGFAKMAEITADKAADILADADKAYTELKNEAEASEGDDL